MRTPVAVLAAGLLALGLGAAAAAPARPARDVVLNVLPPGESGSFALGPHSTDQLRLYDRLTPMFGSVRAADLPRTSKSERFGLVGQRPIRVERPRRGVRILRDSWDVPHVYGRTRADVEFGAGWATAEPVGDRPSDHGRRAAGGLHVSRDPHGVRPPRRRHRRARRRLPGALVLRPPRPRQGLRVERDLGRDRCPGRLRPALCVDETHYLFKGECREMGTFDAGTLRGPPACRTAGSSTGQPFTGR
ncbi:MAG TPA: penicillin acylase family protein [Gaiellaceae bacterium]|nr:penicillin acylase family protein [Gaiellaceae bacterium]